MNGSLTNWKILPSPSEKNLPLWNDYELMHEKVFLPAFSNFHRKAQYKTLAFNNGLEFFSYFHVFVFSQKNQETFVIVHRLNRGLPTNINVSYIMEFLAWWVKRHDFYSKINCSPMKLLYFVNCHSMGTTNIRPNFRK